MTNRRSEEKWSQSNHHFLNLTKAKFELAISATANGIGLMFYLLLSVRVGRLRRNGRPCNVWDSAEIFLDKPYRDTSVPTGLERFFEMLLPCGVMWVTWTWINFKGGSAIAQNWVAMRNVQTRGCFSTERGKNMIVTTSSGEQNSVNS